MEKGLLNEGEESGREGTSGRVSEEEERRRNKKFGGGGKEALAVGGEFPLLFGCLAVWLFGYFYFGYFLRCPAQPTWGQDPYGTGTGGPPINEYKDYKGHVKFHSVYTQCRIRRSV